jgi:adenosylmethionine-8-amino-7-oxononanoate aminotransferase
VLAANIERGKRIDARLRPLSDHARVRHYRRRGMIFAFDVDADPGFGRRYYRAALARGVLMRPIGNTVYLMPPYVLGEAEIELLGRVTREALEEALKP